MNQARTMRPAAARLTSQTMQPAPPHRALRILGVVVAIALCWVLLPFYGSILWACIIALVFSPLHRPLLRRTGHRRNLAASLTLTAALVMLIIPLALVTAALAREAGALYRQLQSGEANPALYFHGLFDALPAWVGKLLARVGIANFEMVQVRLAQALTRGTELIATQAFSLGQNTFDLLTGLCITLYLAFFMIRDGERLVREMRRALPLEPAHQQELFAKFNTVIRATVKGNLLVAAIQGLLGGLAFWFLGVPVALLGGVLMAFLSLLPAVGAALVWLPVAIWLLMGGALWQGLALIAWGVLVIGLIDNLLRPLLVGKDTRMPDYVVMITTLGGMAVFGVNGFVLGPVIAAMFLSVWHLNSADAATLKA